MRDTRMNTLPYGRGSDRSRDRKGALLLLLVALPLCAGQSITEQGISAFQQGRYVEACRLLQEAAGGDPGDEHARAFLALSRAAGGHCAEAIGDLTARFDNSANPDLARLAGLALVQCMSTAGDTDKALAVATQLEAKYPGDADVLYQSASLHMKAFNDVTRHMFEKTPASYRVNQLSAEIFETQSRFSEAAGEYRKAISKNPQAVNLHFRLGRAILRSEEHTSELQSLRHLVCRLLLEKKKVRTKGWYRVHGDRAFAGHASDVLVV